MISPQPILSFKYFQLGKNRLPKGIKKLFYLSWEDALWDVLDKKRVKKGSIILIPDFYCKDVEKNIKEHGYKTSYYKILPNLKVDKESFVLEVRKNSPSVIIIFHPVGIKSNLLGNQEWLAKISGNSILIEDSVHRVLLPGDFKIIKDNHFIIDSLRKVVPLQGASLYGRREGLNFDLPGIFQSFFYRTEVSFYWFLMVVCWTLGFGRLAEKLMLKGYEIIGDSKKPSRGSMLAKMLSDHLNVSGVQKEKVMQSNIYERLISGKILHNLKIKQNDKKHLRGYPVILSVRTADKILSYLRFNGLLVRFELDGSLWSSKRKIIYLPLGPQMNRNSQMKVCDLVNKTVEL